MPAKMLRCSASRIVPRQLAAFTLIELFIVMAVVSLLVSVGLPSLRDMVLDGRRWAVITDLVWALNLARNETATRGEDVTVCPSRDGLLCAPSTSDWSDGWLVYVNADRSYFGREPDPGEKILRYFPNAGSGVRLASNSGVAYTFRSFDVRSDAGSIVVCDQRGVTNPLQRRAVVVSVTGRVRQSSTALPCP